MEEAAVVNVLDSERQLEQNFPDSEIVKSSLPTDLSREVLEIAVFAEFRLYI